MHTEAQHTIKGIDVYFSVDEVRASNVARCYTRQRSGTFSAHEVKDYGWLVKDDKGNYYDFRGKLPERVALFF